MLQSEAIWQRARNDLAIPTEQGQPDLFLVEYSERVARTGLAIARLPSPASESPDETAVLLAALYHESGWVRAVRDQPSWRRKVLTRAQGEDHYERGIAYLKRRMQSDTDAESLQCAADAIRALGQKSHETVEARILADAVALDQFGVISLWQAVRRGVDEGTGVQSVLDRWRRRNEFRYWDVVMKENIYFPEVREIARRRLQRFAHLMEQVAIEQTGGDLA